MPSTVAEAAAPLPEYTGRQRGHSVPVSALGDLNLGESTVRYVGTEEDWRVYIGRSVPVDDVLVHRRRRDRA